MATYDYLGDFALTYGWPYGDHTWKQGMDNNLILMTALLNGVVASRTTWPLPDDAPLMTTYIIPPGATGEAGAWVGSVAISMGGDVWKVVGMQEGSHLIVLDESLVVAWMNGIWGRVGWVGSAPPPNDRMELFAYAPVIEGAQLVWKRITAGSIRLLTAPHGVASETPPSTPYSLNLMHMQDGAGVTQVGTVTFDTDGGGTVTVASEVVLLTYDVLFLQSTGPTDATGMAVTLSARREFDVS